MSPYSVNVTGIASTTTQKQLNEFFTFCGTITSIERKENSETATVNFEKSSAAKTALMLNGGTLDGSTLTVHSDIAHEDEHENTKEGHPIDQSDKPRAGIAAEYLARGYSLSDQILQRAIELDQKQGISKRFLSYFQSLDKSAGERALGPQQTLSGKAQSTVDAAMQHAKAMDEQKGYTKVAQDYYSKAISSSFGQKVKAFYTDTSKQILDIHEEARRIADEEKRKAGAESHPSSGIPDPKTQAAPTVV